MSTLAYLIVNPCSQPDCPHAFRTKSARKIHMKKVHNIVFEEKPVLNDENSDDLYNYSKAHLSLGTLLHNAHDAVKEGDGGRLENVLSVLTYIFKAMGHTKYAYACLRLSACRLSLLSPRRYHQLIHNRFVNVKGKKGACISRDLRLEHLNAVIKPMIKSVGYTNISNKLAEETSRALAPIEKIVKNTKEDVGHSTKSGAHTNKHSMYMYNTIYQEIHEGACNWTYTPGRQLQAYRGIKSNILERLDPSDLYKWIKGHRDKWHSENLHLYKFEH